MSEGINKACEAAGQGSCVPGTAVRVGTCAHDRFQEQQSQAASCPLGEATPATAEGPVGPCGGPSPGGTPYAARSSKSRQVTNKVRSCKVDRRQVAGGVHPFNRYQMNHQYSPALFLFQKVIHTLGKKYEKNIGVYQVKK